MPADSSFFTKALFETLAQRSQSSRFYFRDRDLEASRFFQEAKALGQLWLAQGVGVRDVVAVCGSKAWMLKGLLASLSVGAVFCPVAPDWKERSLAFEGKGACVWWHCEGEELKCLKEAYGPWQFLLEMEHPALLLRTSASLSEGRWVGYEAKNIFQQLQLHQDVLTLLRARRLQLLPLYHTFGLILDTLFAFYQGQDILFIEMDEVSKGGWLKYLHQTSWDMALTPRLAFLAARWAQAKGHLMGLLHVGGAPLTTSCRQLCEKVFREVKEGYGLTECGPGVLIENRPLAGVELRLEPVEKDIGVLWVKTPMLGSWHQQKSQLVHGWLCTQDLACCERGLWKIVGRSSRCFKQTDGRWSSLESFEHQVCERFHLAGIKINPAPLGGYNVYMLEEEMEKSQAVSRFLEERMGLVAVIQSVNENRLLQQTTKALL
jgi:acyl-CoA synthetase (AMP-forming)/AMP-acid ligase II